MECYIKIRDNLFYRIRKSQVISVNTKTNEIRNAKTLPSAYIHEIDVITKEDFENAKKQVGI
jgi:hypothetical protein